MSTYAQVIADSISPEGYRLTTFEVRFHRFVLSEFNTHRVFSRNSASSRAIPVRKQLERVLEDPALPVKWPAEQRGMQGGDEVEDAEEAREGWRSARRSAIESAKWLTEIGVHKSVVNRLLEPFLWHTVIVTATAWDNFFAQRCSPLAQPEIREAAVMMREAYRASRPTELKPGMYHLPYIHDRDLFEVWEGAANWEEVHRSDRAIGDLIKISVARCARVSYLTHDGKRDIAEDIALYDKLVSADPMHASPLEHVATPDPWNIATFAHQDGRLRRLAVPEGGSVTENGGMDVFTLPQIGNFVGWRQHRLEVEMERGLISYA